MKHRIFALSTALFIFLVGCSAATQPDSTGVSSPLSLDDIPSYSGDPYIPVNGNAPDFSDADLSTDAFESYSDLDQLGRCGTAYANICIDTMPTEKRSNIGSIRPVSYTHLDVYKRQGRHIVFRHRVSPAFVTTAQFTRQG